VPGHDASPAVGVRLQRLDPRESVDRIAEDDRALELPFEDGEKREGVDARSLAHQAGGDGKTKQSMGHWPPKRVVLRGKMIDVQRIEVPGETCEHHHIGFRHGPARTFPLIADHEIIKGQD